MTKRLSYRALFSLLAGLALVLAAGAARAELTITIGDPNVQPLPIAIPDFGAQSPGGSQIGHNITEVITNDLQSSGLFRPLDPHAFTQTGLSVNDMPRFPDWRLINAQALVVGGAETQPDGRLKVEYRLWDVLGAAYLSGQAYTTPTENWRLVAHRVADDIYKRLTGEDGYFNTRVVYVAETGPADRRIKRMAIMDQDGFNNHYLTDGRYLVLTPRFSPTSQEITYLSYAHGTPRVYLFNIDTGQQEVVGDFPGMTFAPRFSPDGNRVIFSLSTNGATSIYTMDLRTRHVSQITTTNAIDTSPCYSPDGKFITFNSDR
ncbi:MAG TPA: Tol-Pal system protein TolB, partial [Stellaceae bacterium]|nr:Tol-Pal system protein TolB [Stellaceae bacterium]